MYNKKTIEDIDVAGKRVLARCDFNVPMADGEITDDKRIREALPTIKYLASHGAKVILCSHMGRPKGEFNMKYSLAPVAKRLSEMLEKEVVLANDVIGEDAHNKSNALNNGDIMLIENVRFHKEEEKNDPAFAKELASLADIFVNDAFGTAHRAHASTAGVADYLPSVCGYLIQKEISIMGDALSTPKRPFVAILGGAKVSDKIGVINNLIEKVDTLIIGGAMAYTFLKVKGINVGKSLIDEESLDFAKDMLEKTNKIILPIDHIVSDDINNNESLIKETLNDNDIGLDIGPKTIELFKSYIEKCETIFWNGPMGYYENEVYQKGTKELCEFISKLDIISVVGGGDTASCVINMGYKDKFTHVSTGGGASLELIEGKDLPGINI